MNTPLFDRAMVVKLFAVFTLIGTVAAVLPIPRFGTDIKGVGLESPLHKEIGVKLSAMEQHWQGVEQ
ncbi:MAG: hypothetical protein KME27_23430 [Lyngbya sp. HA4199-MV5]|nr:hypothetical protein [Lyngbya sp. HA4199-MV5]